MNPGAFDLSDACDDAMRLLDYSARHGITVNAKLKKGIIHAHSTGAGSLTEKEEIDFFEAFSELSEQLRPVTPASIKYTEGTGVQGIARRRFQVPIYVIGSALALAIVIGLQAFWVGGTSLVNDVHANLARVESLQADIIAAEAELGDAATSVEVDIMYVQLRSAFARLNSDYESLHKWNELWSSLPLMQPPFQTSSYAEYDVPTRANVDLASSKLFLQALYSYALPLLYGLLGSFFYVLRTLTHEIRTWTFTQQSSITYMLRITLGPLAGLAVGLLLPQPAELAEATGEGAAQTYVADLRALGPLTLAFVAGYGVELVFSLMDRIVGAFSESAARAA